MSAKYNKLEKIAEAFEYIKKAEAAILTACQDIAADNVMQSAVSRLADTKSAIANAWFMAK